MLLEIDGVNPNPTQVLINAIQQRGGTGLTKEEEFYLGFLDNGVSFLKSEKSVFPDYLQDVKRVIKILSGDPSRGAMSLDMEDSIITGQAVQVSKENMSHELMESSCTGPLLLKITFPSLIL